MRLSTVTLEMHVFVNDLADIVRRLADRLELRRQRAVKGGDIGTMHDQVGARVHPGDFVMCEIMMDTDADVVARDVVMILRMASSNTG